MSIIKTGFAVPTARTDSKSVWCNKFKCHESDARNCACVFWEREPGADDEADPAFWRDVMERAYPPKPRRHLIPRTLAESRAIMGAD
jgi:hypothetical protein